MDAFKTMSEAVESGKPTKCTITYSSPDMEDSMEITYYIKGKNMMVESSVQGMDSVFIVKDEVAYTKPLMTDSDCDWMSVDTSEGEESEQEEIDYTQYQDDSTYNIECSPESFTDSKFDVTGKVCSMEDLMAGMIG